MPIIRRTVHYSRKNGGTIKLDTPIHGITAMKISNVIYEGGDFQKSDITTARLLVNEFVRGIELGTPTGNQKYTAIFSADEDGEWNGNDSEWDWTMENDEDEPGEKKVVIDVEIKALINYNKAKDVKLTVELTFQTE